MTNTLHYQELLKELERSNLLLEQNYRDLDKTARELQKSKADLEKSLEEVEYLNSYLEAIFKNISAAILVVDDEGVVETVNRETERITGFSRDEIVGKGILELGRELYSETDLEKLNELAQQLREGKSSKNIEVSFRNKSGEIRYGLVSSAVFERGEKGGKSNVWLGLDITQIKNLERQVVQNEKLASLGSLTAGIAHELNSPLSVISADAQLLQSRVGEKEIDKVARILEAVERIQVLARDLTTYARFEVAIKDWVGINQLIERALTLLHYEIRKGSFEMKLSLFSGNPRVFGNASSIEQVIINLLINSIQAMKERKGEIRVVTSILPDQRVEFRVEDDGVGIAEENLCRIFDPFFSTKEGGSGLGLTIVKNILELHESDYGIKNINNGVEFYFSLKQK